MAMQTLEPERGDNRDPGVEVERLHEMTDHTFRGYVSDAPEAGIGDVVMYPTRQPNSPFVLGGMALRRSFMRPGQMPEFRESKDTSSEKHNSARDPSVMPSPTTIPPANYLG